MSDKPLLLVLGAGPRIGCAVAERFAQDGYEVAVALRIGVGGRTEERVLSIRADFLQFSSILSVF